MKKKSKYFLKIICLIFLFLTTVSISVSGHSVYVDVVQQTITVEAYYGDGRPAKDADITIYKANGETYLTGLTDEDGRYSFDIEEGVNSENLIVEVEQVGHKASVSVGSISTIDNTDTPFLGFQAIAGIGYLLGIAGLVSLYSAWQMKNSGKKK